MKQKDTRDWYGENKPAGIKTKDLGDDQVKNGVGDSEQQMSVAKLE